MSDGGWWSEGQQEINKNNSLAHICLRRRLGRSGKASRICEYGKDPPPYLKPFPFPNLPLKAHNLPCLHLTYLLWHGLDLLVVGIQRHWLCWWLWFSKQQHTIYGEFCHHKCPEEMSCKWILKGKKCDHMLCVRWFFLLNHLIIFKVTWDICGPQLFRLFSSFSIHQKAFIITKNKTTKHHNNWSPEDGFMMFYETTFLHSRYGMYYDCLTSCLNEWGITWIFLRSLRWNWWEPNHVYSELRSIELMVLTSRKVSIGLQLDSLLR